MSRANPKSWTSGWHWRQRIINFEPSWFTIIMGTGTIQACFVNFPYPITGGAPWIRDIGYCLWILEVILFGIFAAFLITRYIRHPQLLRKNLLEFPASSYFGAIAISWNIILQGIVSYYDYRSSAVWAVFGLYWVALAGSLLVTVGIIIVQMIRANKQELNDVAGVWCMVTVPLLSNAATAGTLLPYLASRSTKCAIAVLVTGYMSWFLALSELMFILTVYFFRLIANKLPAQPLITSSLLPVAALTQGAFAIHKLSIYLANYIKSSGFGPTQVEPPLSTATLLATAEVIHWLGILISLGLLAHATFWIVQAICGLIFMLPVRSFNIGHWSLVFPIASYANAWASLSRDLRNDGMRGWAATMTVLAVLLWLVCSACTCYIVFWKGSLFAAPGLEDWLGDQEEQDVKGRGGRRDNWDGTYSLPDPWNQSTDGGDEERGEANGHRNNDGNGNETRRRP
ncbi:voltage-dependent anion channel-domain-containing protein [Delphinella strobiligena]|nr:voltage-dependent anion channel-domain-containing protein [Delphinella strobiligena]